MARTRKVTIMKARPGKKAVRIRPGGLHRSTNTPMGQKIPASKIAAAKAGRYGPLAKKQANMASGMLAKGRKTAARHQAMHKAVHQETNSANLYMMAEKKIARKRARRGR